jgi:AcrR family transcriptional regulator
MAETRERLLTATNEVFRRRGYHGASLKAIIAAADATVGSLYHFFPGGKDELAEVSLETSGASSLALFDVIAAETAGPVEAVRAFFDGAAEVLEQTDFIDICPIGTVAREVASSNELLRLATDRVFRSWTESLSARLAGAGLDAAAAASLATTVVAALEGGFMLARARRDGDVLRAIGRHVGDLVAATLATTSQR